MHVLVTGSQGYLGTVLMPALSRAGHDAVGCDSDLFAGCDLGPAPGATHWTRDVRSLQPADLAGFDAIVHLAGISNDPLGNLDAQWTDEINHRATVQLAATAKKAGVPRFLFASSCSLYGVQGDGFVDEEAELLPVTPYGRSKKDAEEALTALADDDFSPVFLRNATVYGVSPRLRGDLVVNNLTGYAVTTGRVLLKSDGTPWRPLLHVEDVARAVVGVLGAPRELVHAEAFNVGASEENYQMREVAEIVAAGVPHSRIELGEGAGPDIRNYRVDCSKLAALIPDAAPRRTVADGVSELVAAYEAAALTESQLTGSRFQRIVRIQQLLAEGRLGPGLRWVDAIDERLPQGAHA